MIKNKILGIAFFDYNKNKIAINKEIKHIQKYLKNSIFCTEKHLIIGGIRRIYLYNIKNDYQLETIELFPEEEATFICKINDQLFLVSTTKGYILQIIIDNGIQTKRKFIDFKIISSILMINYETILISGNDGIYVLSIMRERENKDQKCEVF